MVTNLPGKIISAMTGSPCMPALRCSLVLLALLFAGRAGALDLDPGHYYRHIASEFRYYIAPADEPLAPETAIARLPTDFRELPANQIDFGFTSGTIWLYLQVTNRSDRADTWILSLNSRFMNELRVYQRRTSGWEQLLDNSERSNFAERPLDYRLLAVEFSLDAGEESAVLIAYRSRGTSYLPVSIESAQSFADARSLSNTKSGGFYTAAALMFLYSLFQLLLLGNRIQIHYLAYLSAAVLYVFHMDGLSFQYLWSELPLWNAFASLPLGLLVNIMAANFSRHFLETWRTAPKLDKLILAVIALSIMALLFGLFVEDRYIKRASFWLTSAGSIIYLSAGVHALLKGNKSARFYVAGWVGICTASILSSMIHSLPGVLPVSLSFDITKAGILFDALMFGMALADRAAEVRRQRDAALQREMRMLSEAVQANKALEAAQQGERDALQIAERQNLQLATASHDIRQPLASLKIALKNMDSGTGSGANPRGAMESIEYLDALVNNYLDSARTENLFSAEAQEAILDQERFPVQMVIDAVREMFELESVERGLELRTVNSSLWLKGDAIAILRIVSNLVKNAIQHAAQGKVLLGCRRQTGACVINVVDTGVGIPDNELERLRLAFEQGTDAGDGHGLGLHIVDDLCRKNGHTFSIESRPGRGTRVAVSIALA